MKQKRKKEQSFMNVMSAVVSLYLLVMLGIFPIYYKYQYANMGDEKYKIFLYSSSICIVVFFLLLLYQRIFLDTKSKQTFSKQKIQVGNNENRKGITKLDTAVFIYFICTTISFLLSPFKETGFWGSDGWSMGYLSQILFVAIYFLIAKGWKYQRWAWWLLGLSSAIVFIVAIFHRFDVELLHIYGDLDLYYKVLFLSTMGQSSWYSSFLCTVFPGGVYLFFISEDKKVRMISGIYSVVAMLTLVTQNTDSAFMSLFAVMMVLFYLSFDRRTVETARENKINNLQSSQHKQFLQVVILILASFCFMGLCQRLFTDRMIPLDTMSIFMSQSILMWILLAGVIVCSFIICRKTRNRISKKDETESSKKTESISRKPFWILLAIVGIGILATTIFIILNTNGFLLEKFGYQSTNNYLLFDDQWGNGRGFAWKFAAGSFVEFPFLRKLFGVGPDCFSAYIASVPEYLEEMNEFWGDLVLTNAHNEYLTKLYNLGIVGLLSYIGMLVTAVWTFIKNRYENPLLPAFALCVVSYMVHNIFCYEQVCCTPFMYILMGIGSNLTHNKQKKSTY